MSLFSVLFVVFLVLKITGYITWSWFAITAPLWGGLLLMITLVIFAAIATTGKRY